MRVFFKTHPVIAYFILTLSCSWGMGSPSVLAEENYRDVGRSSFYLTMRDGIRIAIDLYLPEGLANAQKIPAIVRQTRYGRRLDLKLPYSWVVPHTHWSHILEPRHMRLFVTHGYAWVDVDVRGSGASFGSIAYPFSTDEIKDGDEIVNWIVRQPWSDGKVGAAGLSYAADSAEFLLTNNNPAVKAIVPYYPDWDIYNDTSFPGGIYLSWFIENWSRVDDILDRNAFDDLGAYSWYIPYVVRGFAPVDGLDGDALLR